MVKGSKSNRRKNGDLFIQYIYSLLHLFSLDDFAKIKFNYAVILHNS